MVLCAERQLIINLFLWLQGGVFGTDRRDLWDFYREKLKGQKHRVHRNYSEKRKDVMEVIL